MIKKEKAPEKKISIIQTIQNSCNFSLEEAMNPKFTDEFILKLSKKTATCLSIFTKTHQYNYYGNKLLPKVESLEAFGVILEREKDYLTYNYWRFSNIMNTLANPNLKADWIKVLKDNGIRLDRDHISELFKHPNFSSEMALALKLHYQIDPKEWRTTIIYSKHFTPTLLKSLKKDHGIEYTQEEIMSTIKNGCEKFGCKKYQKLLEENIEFLKE